MIIQIPLKDCQNMISIVKAHPAFLKITELWRFIRSSEEEERRGKEASFTPILAVRKRRVTKCRLTLTSPLPRGYTSASTVPHLPWPTKPSFKCNILLFCLVARTCLSEPIWSYCCGFFHRSTESFSSWPSQWHRCNL